MSTHSEGELPFGLIHNKKEKTFYFRRTKNNTKRYFSYGRGRDFEKVRAEAIEFAINMNAQLGPPDYPSPKGRKTKRNHSGVVGVSLDPNKVRGHIYYTWIARWPSNRPGLRFSVNRHGDDKAFLLACIARELESKDRDLIEKEYFDRQQSGGLQRFLDMKNQSVKGQNG